MRQEVEKAKSFKPPLNDWTLATTAKKDAKIEEIARLISEEHAKTGLFSVHVLGWEDLQSLQSLIGNYPGVIEPLAETSVALQVGQTHCGCSCALRFMKD